MQLKTMRYIHNLHTSLADVRIGEKVVLAHRPDPSVLMRVSNGVVASVNAATLCIAWEGNNPPPLDTFTEDQLCYLAFEQPEPSISVDML